MTPDKAGHGSEPNAPEGYTPTGRYVEVTCGDRCSILDGITVTMKEFRHFSGRKSYGLCIPLFGKIMACLISDDYICEQNSKQDVFIDEAVAKMLRATLHREAEKKETIDGFIPFKA